MDVTAHTGLPSPTGGEPETLSSMYRQVLEILRLRWRTLAATFVTIAVLGTAYTMMLTPRYQATARVKIDPSKSAALGQITDAASSIPDQSVVETEVSVMRSHDIAAAVVAREHLLNDPEFTKGMPPLGARATPAQIADRTEAVAQAVLGRMSASREKATYIVEVGFTSTNPEKAARIANAFAETYIDASLTRRNGTASRQAEFLQKRLSSLSAQATAADERLASYRAASGVVQTGGGSTSVIDQQIAPLAGQLATAQSDAAAAASKVAAARAQIRTGGIDAVSAVLDSEVIKNLRSQRAQLLSEQGEVSTRYGPKHPETQRIAQQIRTIDQQILDEANRVIGGLESEARAASARAASLQANLNVLRGRQAQTTRASAMAETYERQADSSKQAYDRLAQQAQTSDQAASSSLSQAQVIENATPPSSPSKPNKRMLLAATFVGALLAGLGVVCLQELTSRGLRSIADVRRLGLDVLATVPRLGRGHAAPADEVIAKPMSSFAEAYRVTRRSLASASSGRPMVVAITSTLPNEGKTTSALSLARIMAMAGEKTLLIDTDLRRAGLREATGITPERGLVELLHGDVTLAEAVVADQVEGLDLLPVAQANYSPEDLFSGDAMADLLTQVRGAYDRIVLDCAPLLGVADARTVAMLSDAVLMVIKWNATPRNAIATGLNWLARDKAPVTGALLTMVDRSVEAYGALYYSKKYAEYYRAE